MGKILILWVLVLALIVVIAVDGGGIGVTKIHTRDLARTAAGRRCRGRRGSQPRAGALAHPARAGR